MPELAKVIEVRIGTTGKGTIRVDGEEFPWYTGGLSWDADPTAPGMPTVELSLMAERVDIVHGMDK